MAHFMVNSHCFHLFRVSKLYVVIVASFLFRQDRVEVVYQTWRQATGDMKIAQVGGVTKVAR